jgi:two-component system, cell cycle response regulator DivK
MTQESTRVLRFAFPASKEGCAKQHTRSGNRVLRFGDQRQDGEGVNHPVNRPLVLIAGPELHGRERHATCLAAADLGVEQAHNGRQALDKAVTLRPDVIAMDLSSSHGLNSLEVCRQLSREPATKSIPIVAMAELWPPGQVDEARAAGCASVLAKPCPPERLLVEILWVLGQQEQDGPANGTAIQFPNTVEFLIRTLRAALDENARLSSAAVDLEASAQLWADSYERAITSPTGARRTSDRIRGGAPARFRS